MTTQQGLEVFEGQGYVCKKQNHTRINGQGNGIGILKDESPMLDMVTSQDFAHGLVIKSVVQLLQSSVCTVDGSNTGQNAITSDTCDADTSNNISPELGNTGQI